MHLPRHLKTAVGYAREHKFDPTVPALVTAVLISGGRMLSVGYNSRVRSAMQDYYRTNEFCTSVHAETDAILGVRRKVDLRGSKIFVVRRLRFDSANTPALGLAKPCPMCQAILFSYGIKKAIYTIGNDEYGVVRITDPRQS